MSSIPSNRQEHRVLSGFDESAPPCILPATLAALLGTSASGIPLANLPPITHVFACPENRSSAATDAFLSQMVDG